MTKNSRLSITFKLHLPVLPSEIKIPLHSHNIKVSNGNLRSGTGKNEIVVLHSWDFARGELEIKSLLRSRNLSGIEDRYRKSGIG